MGATFMFYFLSSLLLTNCIPVFDYYDQAYDQLQYDDQNNLDSNSSLLESDYTTDKTDNTTNNQQVEKYSVEYSNGTAKDLYVIRTIIYEIGILANPDGSKNASAHSEMQDQVDISLFKPTKDELIDETKIPELIKGQVNRLTNSALRSLDVVPLIEISTKNKSSTEIRQLSYFPNSFVRLTANISTIRGDDDTFNKEETNSQVGKESSTLISKNVETRTTVQEEDTTNNSE